MKINSYLLIALFCILLSYSLADEISKQETTTKKTKEATDKVEAKGEEGQYGVNYGGGGGGGYSGGGGGHGGGGSGWGGGCRHGCCYRGHGGSCNKCCASPEEAKALSEKQVESTNRESADAHKVEAKGEEGQYGVNYGGGGGGGYSGGGGGHGGGGSGWGGGCRHGCCYRGHGGSCNKCCSSPEEAKALSQKQSEATNKESADTNKVEDKGVEGQYGVNYGGGGGGGYSGGGGGGGHGGGGSGWGGGCRHGCCYRGHGGSCNKCCASPEEAKAVAENKGTKGDEGKYGVNYGGGGGNHGGGGGGSNWGGGCRHGCCYQGHGGSCNKCCSSPQEAKAFAESQSRP